MRPAQVTDGRPGQYTPHLQAVLRNADNLAPDPVSKIQDPDPAWIWSKMLEFFVIFISFQVDKRFLLEDHFNNKKAYSQEI